MYKTELHLHNAAISRCAHTTDEEIVAVPIEDCLFALRDTTT